MSNMKNTCSDLTQSFFLRERETERRQQIRHYLICAKENLRTSIELEITIILEFSSKKGMIKTDNYC